MQAFVAAMPSVGAYCSARAAPSAAIFAVSAASDSAGNVDVSGSPPASEITSGRSVMAMRSRIAEDFMTFVREANSAAYRSRSRVERRGVTGRFSRPGGPGGSSTVIRASSYRTPQP
jgi:hypothetical protein